MDDTASANPALKPCPACGGSNFTEGEVVAYGQLQFVKAHKPGLKPAGQAISHARKCADCGHVQLFGKLG